MENKNKRKSNDNSVNSNKKKKSSKGSLLNNDKFVLALSFLASFFIWTVMSMNNGETVNYPITSIPITMELSENAKDDGLSVVTVDGVYLEDFEATVRVKGNSVTVGSLKPSDIQVYGMNLGNIVTSGSYTVSLSARQTGVKNNYDIVSVTPSEVKVTVDRWVENSFSIEPQINATSPVEYYIGSASLSESTVNVEGPEQILSKAVKAVVINNVEDELEETTTLHDMKIQLLDSDGNVLDNDMITMVPDTVDAVIPVLVKKTVPLKIDYLNAPMGFDGGSFIHLEPSEIEVAASSDIIDSITSISAGTIDFSTISYGMSAMSGSIVMPEGVRNLNNVENVSIQFDFSDYFTRSFIITNFDYLNVPQGLAAEHSAYERLTVRVIGPKEEVAELTTDDVTAQIDLSESKIGTAVMPVNVIINKSNGCWVYGSYTLNVTVKDKDDVTSDDVSSATHSASSSE